jgi:hypothetical protein
MSENGKPDNPVAQSHEDPQHSLDRKRYKVEIITALLLFLYVTIAAFQWCEMRRSTENNSATLREIQKQTTLMRQQLVGTLGAIVTLPEPHFTDDIFSGKNFMIGLLNQGHVMSQEGHVRFQISRESFPSLKPLWESKIYTASTNQILPGAGWNQAYRLTEFWPDFSLREQQVTTQRKTLMVKGTYGFDDGFGEKYEHEFCFSYIGRFNVKNEGGAGGSTSGGDYFMDCDGFRERASYILKHQLN